MVQILFSFIYNNFISIILCFIAYDSLVLGLYLPSQGDNYYIKVKGNSTRDRRSVGTNKNYLWPGSMVNGVWTVDIPYTIEELDPEVENYFHKMREEFERHSCVRWVPWTDQDEVVELSDKVPANWTSSRCRAGLGRGPTGSQVFLSRDCLGLTPHYKPATSNLIHEMFHVLNFIHEHQRKDRDCYIDIPEEIIEADRTNYAIYKHQDTDLTFPYDEQSIMQYPDSNIKSRWNKKIGPNGDLPSVMDWAKVNYYYCDGLHYCDLSESTYNHCIEDQQMKEQCGIQAT